MHYEKGFSDALAALTDVHTYLRDHLAETRSEKVTGAFCRLRLAAHEWLANLARHAQFGKRTPLVRVRMWQQDARLYCTVEDNSDGFDLAGQLGQQAERLSATPLPEGGMGLLLLQACADHPTYAASETAPGEPRNRFSFSVDTTACPLRPPLPLVWEEQPSSNALAAASSCSFKW